MRISLINPPYVFPFIREGRCQSPQSYRENSVPQMTLAYLAGILKRAGHEIQVFDCIALGIDEEQLLNRIGAFNPELVFFNTTTPTIQSDLQSIEGLKQRFPEVLTAAFGAHITVLHQNVMKAQPCLDIAIRGEPEFTALDIASGYAAGSLRGEIAGCTVRAGDSIRVYPDRKPEEDLDRLGPAAWEYLPIDRYIHPVFKKPYLTVNTGRGCTHRCIFCVAPGYYGRTVRHRSSGQIVEELDRCRHNILIKHFWFYADDFTASPEFVKELCREIIDRRLDIVWWSNTRVDKPDEEMFSLMREAGCFMLSVGGESGSADILKTMRKGVVTSDTEETVRMLRKAGIQSVVYFLIGLPGETAETIGQTVEFSKKINPDYVEFYPATPYPGTVFHDMAVEAGMLVQDDWSGYQYNDFVVEIPGIERDGLRKMLRRAYLSFYLRPRYLGVLLRRLSHPADFFRLMKFGFGYLRNLLSRK